MYDHIGLKVSDLDAAIRFYTAALAPLGHVLCSRDESSAGFGPPDAPALWLYRGKNGDRAFILRFAQQITPRSGHFMSAVLKRAATTMARPGYGPTIARLTMPRS
jgi:catechol 2,3-dioxygenase-like lactoylglutathione lyase family enzyme